MTRLRLNIFFTHFYPLPYSNIIIYGDVNQQEHYQYNFRESKIIIDNCIIDMYNNSYIANQQRFPYVEASDYKSLASIVEAFPHLKNINQNVDWSNKANIMGLIIRSANDDNVHKAIKYGIWTTTIKNRTKLNQLYFKAKSQGKEIYLFFSVVKSGMFQGVAKLTSNITQDTFPYWWDDVTHKFKDYFKIEWVYIKDVNFPHFNQLYNCQNEQITASKDCDMVDTQTTQKMLQIFCNKPMKNKWIFNDFEYMDKRQKQYTRKNQCPFQQQQYDYSQMQMMNNYMGYVVPNNQMIPLPPQMFKPLGPDTKADFGFQKNPVSKNRKK